MVMIAVFIYELVVQSKAQGTPISLKVQQPVSVLLPTLAYLYHSQSSILCWVLPEVHLFNLEHVSLRA